DARQRSLALARTEGDESGQTQNCHQLALKHLLWPPLLGDPERVSESLPGLQNRSLRIGSVRRESVTCRLFSLPHPLSVWSCGCALTNLKSPAPPVHRGHQKSALRYLLAMTCQLKSALFA